MGQVRLAKTSNRSVVGMMNEFTFLAEAYPDRELAALLSEESS